MKGDALAFFEAVTINALCCSHKPVVIDFDVAVVVNYEHKLRLEMLYEQTLRMILYFFLLRTFGCQSTY